MSLIDLAGSERADDKQFDQDRIREAKAINKSLSTLKDCIAPIVKNQSLEENDPKIHVPYRNSPLTFMLQDCLSSESSKTLMIVAVSPLPEHFGETVTSLKFARMVN
jgi:hypothetical protein